MPIEVSAPGRICLFGEHQDFLGLSVIASPIDLDIRIVGTPRDDHRFLLRKPDLAGRDEPDFDEFVGNGPLEYLSSRDYIRSATNVVRDLGVDVSRGYDCEIRGTIPINAGTSSSSALTVAWITFLLASQADDDSHDREHLANLAYEAEVLRFKEPGGMMDHFASAVGGLLYIDCKPPFSFESLPTRLEGFVLGNTKVKKETTGVLGRSRQATQTGLDLLRERIPGFDIKTTPREEAEEHFGDMDEPVRRRVHANFVNRDLCQEALVMLRGSTVDQEKLGAMLYEHQVQLRDGIGVSHERLDALLDAAMEAGALGGKLNGSGCGGAMFAYAPGKQEEVAEAIEREGGDAYIVSLRGGVSVRRW